uniref:Uncharacterized protein n=1 Tax=Anguilla anguilla TaxID=7936 RepID=A0A0E9XSE1_ANGAN
MFFVIMELDKSLLKGTGFHQYIHLL